VEVGDNEYKLVYTRMGIRRIFSRKGPIVDFIPGVAKMIFAGGPKVEKFLF